MLRFKAKEKLVAKVALRFYFCKTSIAEVALRFMQLKNGIAEVALRFILLKNWIAKVALRFDLFKNQIALVALRLIAYKKKFCAFLRCASVYSEKMPTSAISLRCVYTEYDEIFRTYSDVGYKTVTDYDVRLRHYPRHSRIQSLGASQNNW